jgi:uncharacterized YigZ family protein
MSYFTIEKDGTGEYEEKKSLFISYVYRTESEENAKEFITHIKDLHKEASHYVYSYIIGLNKDIQRFSDNGEPQGTAGIPTLEVIKRKGLTDLCVVTVRYFGGTLLGSSGLIRAYTSAASKALEAAGIVEKVRGVELKITIEYDNLGKIQHLFDLKKWHISKITYTDKVNLETYCELILIEQIKKLIIDTTSNKCSFQLCNENYYFKTENRLFSV